MSKFGVNPNPSKMSIGWVYSGACCPHCINPKKFGKKSDNSKRITLRTHRKGE